MKAIFVITSFFLSLVAHAQPVRPLILSAGVSPQAYQQYLSQHPQMVPLTEYLAKLPRGGNEDKVYALTDHLEDPVDQLLAEIENQHREVTMNEDTLQFMRDLLDKTGARTLTTSQRALWQKWSCFNDSLLAMDVPAATLKNSPCKTEKADLKDLQRAFPWAEGIKLENRFIRLQSEGQIAVMSNTPYHFQILSNTHRSLNFYGTLEQLRQQSFQAEPLISGNCDEFTSSVDDFSLHETALVYFTESCIQPLKNPIQKSSAKRWVQEHKSWLYAGGAFVLGAVVYGMKNKKLVIDTSGLK